MTYAFCMLDDRDVYVSGDTAVTRRDAIKPDLHPGICKVVPIRFDVVAAFAGEVGEAIKLLRDLRERPEPLSTEKIVSELVLSDAVASGAVEFLVASCAGDVRRVFKVSASGSATGSDFYWIGDVDAAKQHALRSSEHVASMSDEVDRRFSGTVALSAFNSVLSGGLVGVGGSALTMRSRPGFPFYFETVVDTLMDEQAVGPALEVMKIAVPHSNQFVRSVLRPSYPDIAVVAVYVAFADMGWIYRPFADPPVQSIVGVTFHAFRQELHRQTGVLFDGLPVGRIQLGSDEVHPFPFELVFVPSESA